MHIIAKQILQSLVVAGVIPAILISALSGRYSKKDDDTGIHNAETDHYEVQVLGDDGTTQMMELETYVTGVVLGEVPTEFHEEALKAQVVAARTYTLYCVEVLKKHSGGAVCTDHRCCQAYCDPEKFLQEGGNIDGVKKVTSAVKNTAGEILKYNAEIICATYFASSGGMTEDAAEVWGRRYPYLQSVKSPGEEQCGYFSQQMIISPSDLQKALGVHLIGEPSSWFGMVKHTEGGGVDLMRIGGRLYTGVELRRLFNLRSTVMNFAVTDEGIVVDTKGYGHRVGMSQYGANAMAENGSDYRVILAHYFTNTVIDRIRG